MGEICRETLPLSQYKLIRRESAKGEKQCLVIN